MPSKSSDFDLVLPDAMPKFSIVGLIGNPYQEFHHGMNNVSLQKTFQSSISPLLKDVLKDAR
jgi:hypothetical protein